MKKFRFIDFDWRSFIVIGFPVILLFQYAYRCLGLELSVLICILLALLAHFTIPKRYHLSIVEFHNEFLRLSKPFSKTVEVRYEMIEKATYSYDRFHNFYIFFNDSTIKLPSADKLEKMEELFEWLKTKNHFIKTEIYTSASKQPNV